MFSQNAMKLLCTLLVATAVGCGSAPAVNEDGSPAPDARASLKATLTKIAETGEVASAEAELRSALQQLSTSDPLLAQKVAGHTKAFSSGNPEAAKKSAKALLEEF